MGLSDIIAGAVNGIAAPVIKVVDNRSERKHQEGIKKLENAAQSAEWAAQAARSAAELKREDRAADVSWATNAWQNTGWKDELNSIALWSFFFVGIIPPLQPYILNAIIMFSSWPIWLQTIFVAHSLASIGIRLNQAGKLKL